MSLVIGADFPRVPVQSTAGRFDLAERWSRGPLIIAFHRLWCPFCQEAAAQLAQRADELVAAGAGVVLIYPQEPVAVEATCAKRGVPFDCFSDPDRRLEHAADVDRMRPTRYLTPSLPRRFVQALRAGAKVAVPTTDLFQGRGTYVVDTDGRVTWAHVATSAPDIPPIDELVDAVRAQPVGSPGP